MIRTFPAFCAFLLATLLISVAPISTANANPLAGLQWEKRVILLFAKSRSDAALDKQVELLRERRPELRERDMLVIVVEGTQDAIPAIGYTPLPSGSARDLRGLFAPTTRGFTGVLIGKDGMEKSRWQSPAQPDAIFDLVDAMPMRAREIENQATN